MTDAVSEEQCGVASGKAHLRWQVIIAAQTLSDPALVQTLTIHPLCSWKQLPGSVACSSHEAGSQH